MPRKPNCEFVGVFRERQKAAKRADKAAALGEQRDRERAETDAATPSDTTDET